MKRRELREHIFRLLFRVEFNDEADMPEQVALYMEDLPMAGGQDRRYIEQKYQMVMDHLEKIDVMLNEAATGWKVSRMGKVELTILRLAAYEIYFDEDVPTSVAINEAVEMAKEFGGDESPAFINGVLGKLVKTEPKQEKETLAADHAESAKAKTTETDHAESVKADTAEADNAEPAKAADAETKEV